MAHCILIALLLFIAYSSAAEAERKCPVGEVPGRGRVRNCQPACPNEPPHACPFVIGPTCLCPRGQLRNWQKNYACVSPSDCPKKPMTCPPGEIAGTGPIAFCQPSCPNQPPHGCPAVIKINNYAFSSFFILVFFWFTVRWANVRLSKRSTEGLAEPRRLRSSQ